MTCTRITCLLLTYLVLDTEAMQPGGVGKATLAEVLEFSEELHSAERQVEALRAQVNSNSGSSVCMLCSSCGSEQYLGGHIQLVRGTLIEHFGEKCQSSKLTQKIRSKGFFVSLCCRKNLVAPVASNEVPVVEDPSEERALEQRAPSSSRASSSSSRASASSSRASSSKKEMPLAIEGPKQTLPEPRDLL